MLKINDLEKRIGYVFKDKEWVKLALRHSSYTNEMNMDRLDCNERLEFLGDAVLELVSSDYLYGRLPDYPEGKLTKLRASLVCEQSLADVAEQIGLGEYLFLGKGENATGGRSKPSVTSDALEALVGAIYKDGGLEQARRFIFSFILNNFEERHLFVDSKTILQELTQAKFGYAPTYEIKEVHDTENYFESGVVFEGKTYGKGRGRSKKLAEQQAAYQAILKLRSES